MTLSKSCTHPTPEANPCSKKGIPKMDIEISTYTPDLGPEIETLQKKYIAAHPRGTKFVSKELYDRHPALEQGKNVFCASAPDGGLVGYGALIPTPAEPDSPPGTPNTIWIHIRADPEASDFRAIRQAIYGRILEKSLAYSRAWQGRATRLAISYPDSLSEEIEFFASQGLERFEALLQMTRDLSQPTQALALPAGIAVRHWRMETEPEKMAYLAVEAAIFPHSPRTLEELEFYMQSWPGGTPITAFDAQGKVVGSLMAYWYGRRNGVTEDIFVVPQWRRRGIARYLITAGIGYLSAHGIETAWLEVRESNEPAVNLYRSLGYEITKREIQLGMAL